MFIKVFVPNCNGKIELTVKELEELLKDAANKAVTEKCANCTKGYWYSNNNNWISTTPGLTISDPSKDNIVYCSTTTTTDKINNNAKLTVSEALDGALFSRTKGE